MTSILQQLFREVSGREATSLLKLSGDGSNRSYYRISSGDDISMIGVVGTSLQENRAFTALASCLRECGIDAPEVYAVSPDGLCYVQQDLGDTTLFMRMKAAREQGVFSADDTDALCRVMEVLPDIQYRVAAGFDFSQCYQVSDFDRRTVMWDMNYFKYCFLKCIGVEFDEGRLETEFERLADILLDEDCSVFMYRDFQSRNVMWHDSRPWFIDFQGGRRGPVYYDVASFVGQARAAYTPDAVSAMLDAYMRSLAKYRPVDKKDFLEKLDKFRLFRLLQNLGTYGFRGLFERKKAFVESIPAAVTQLNALLGAMQDVFPCLHDIMKRVAVLPRFVPHKNVGLEVDVYSFSYRRGIPEDYSGNGGGFVFDCRAIHNPGRYAPYVKLTGMDEPVIRFLEEKSTVGEFLKNVYSLVDAMVADYLERGFSHIQVCFGCTGGQHRSVYCAEHTARHLSDKYGVRVNVRHIMQNIEYSIDNNKKTD